MAANDDSPGLKIAVAAFISLSVILGVACYFLYSAKAAADARLAAAQNEVKRANAVQAVLLQKYDDLRAKVATESSATERVKKTNEPATP